MRIAVLAVASPWILASCCCGSPAPAPPPKPENAWPLLQRLVVTQDPDEAARAAKTLNRLRPEVEAHVLHSLDGAGPVHVGACLLAYERLEWDAAAILQHIREHDLLADVDLLAKATLAPPCGTRATCQAIVLYRGSASTFDLRWNSTEREFEDGAWVEGREYLLFCRAEGEGFVLARPATLATPARQSCLEAFLIRASPAAEPPDAR